MNPLNDNDPARQAARDWSEYLGSLAGSMATGPETALVRPGAAGAPPVPSRLAAILDHFRARAGRREHAADKLRANEFLTGL
jgi:hypothetical protein